MEVNEHSQMLVNDLDVDVKSEYQDDQFQPMNIEYLNEEHAEIDTSASIDASTPILDNLMQRVQEHDKPNRPRNKSRQTRKQPKQKKKEKPCGRPSQRGSSYIENEKLRISTRSKIRKIVFTKAVQLVQQCGGDVVVIYANERGNNITYTNTEDLWKRLVDNGLSLPDTFKGSAKRVEMVCGDSPDKLKERTVDIVRHKTKKNKLRKQFETPNTIPIPHSVQQVYNVNGDTAASIVETPTLGSNHTLNAKQICSSITKCEVLSDSDSKMPPNNDNNYDYMPSIKGILQLNEISTFDGHTKEDIEAEIRGNRDASMNHHIPLQGQSAIGGVLDLQHDVEKCNNEYKSCDSSFATQSALKKHIGSHKNLNTCLTCDMTFETKSQLRCHIMIHADSANDNNFKCHLCDSSGFETVQDFHKHVDGHSSLEGVLHQELDETPDCFNSDEQQCSSIRPELNKLGGYNDKAIIVYGDNTNPEEDTKIKSETSENTNVEQLKQSTCLNPDTERISSSKRNVGRPRIPFEVKDCKDCGKSIQTVKEKLSHRKVCSKHRIPINCHICGKLFISSVTLRRHINEIHNRTRKVLCSTCGQECSSITTLRQHEQIHLSLDPVPCDKCGKLFKNMPSLQKHVLRFHNDKTFPCSQCDKVLPNSSSYSYHKRQYHSTERKIHPCGVCGKEFKNTTHLKRHFVVHSGDKPYKCAICGGGYAQPHYVKLHMKTVHGVNTLSK